MGLVYATIYLIALLLVGLTTVWLLFYKIPQKETSNALASIDEDLIKTTDRANVHNNRKYFFLLSVFIVSIFTYILITHKDVTIHTPPKPKVVKNYGGEVNEIIETEIKDPPPPKVAIKVKVPVIVPNDAPPPQKDTTVIDTPDDIFGDLTDDGLVEENASQEVPIKEDNVIYDTPGIQPEFPGGDIPLENFVFSQIEPKLEQFDPGFYPVPLEFVVEKNGSITQVKIVDGEEVENIKIAQLIISAIKKSPRWTPGTTNGLPVRVKYQKPFFIEIN